MEARRAKLIADGTIKESDDDDDKPKTHAIRNKKDKRNKK